MTMNFSRNLVALRRKNNITQERMAAECGVSRSAVAKWETGTSVPDLYKLESIKNIFNVTVDELLYTRMEDSEYIFDNGSCARIENKLDEMQEKIIAEIRKRDSNINAYTLHCQYMKENGEDDVPIEAYAYWGSEEALKGNYKEALAYYEEAVIRGDINSIFAILAIYEEMIDMYAYDHNMFDVLQTYLAQASKMQQYGKIMEDVISSKLKSEIDEI